MNRQMRRSVAFAGASFSVVYDLNLADLVDFLYRDIPCATTTLPERVYHLTDDPEGSLVLQESARMLYRSASRAEMAGALLGESCHYLAAESRGGLVFHAAALGRGSQGLLLPGSIGAGKTTLTAWLLLQGYSYLTDELVYVPDGGIHMQTLARPLNLKAGSRGALRSYFDFSAYASRILSTQEADLIPSDVLARDGAPGENASYDTPLEAPLTPVCLIVFPRYVPDSVFELQALSPAQAGLRLMESLVNARNLPAYGFQAVAALARSAPAYALTYSCFDHIDCMLANLLLD